MRSFDRDGPSRHKQDAGADETGEPAEQVGSVPRGVYQKGGTGFQRRHARRPRGDVRGKEHRDGQAKQRPRTTGAGQKARFLHSPRRALLHRCHIRRAASIQNPVDGLAQHEAAIRQELRHGGGHQGVRRAVWPGIYPGPTAWHPDDVRHQPAFQRERCTHGVLRDAIRDAARDGRVARGRVQI